MTAAAIIALIILAAVCAWLVWRAWRRGVQDAAAARSWDRAKAQEAASVEQAQADEAAGVAEIESRRDETAKAVATWDVDEFNADLQALRGKP